MLNTGSLSRATFKNFQHNRACFMRQILLLRPAFASSRHTFAPPLPVRLISRSPAAVCLQRRTFTMSPKTQEPAITKITELSASDAKWVTLKKIEYVDQVGKARTWEAATRKTRGKAGVDAVAMGNILLHPSRPLSTLVVIQYRPPLDAFTVEWPAGLIDAEETPEQAAVREFKEETGYECKVVSVSPVQAADPGMSDANMVLAMVEVHLNEGDSVGDVNVGEEDKNLPVQRLDDGEHIQRVVIPLSEFYDRLVEYSKKERMIVAAKLFHFAAGMHFAKTQTYGKV
ncbi:NUDIX hydrolase domain-like protein [Diplogelasinospora grovesii]|uniref:NUDIX hydrolase domain-like protein n=1 Tax=Diplogelasinospora grovesii TaxID=303347 RepID=A0AAN6RZ12_9PEZI|nr:NUDIX hydrolase domain-like protein [Diplogelasinospora grovesii]